MNPYGFFKKRSMNGSKIFRVIISIFIGKKESSNTFLKGLIFISESTSVQ